MAGPVDEILYLFSSDTSVSGVSAQTPDVRRYRYLTLQVFADTQRLVSNGTIPTSGGTVTVGGTTYTARTALTPTAGEVLIGGSAAAFLTNLEAAVNYTGTPGTQYAGTTANANVSAGALTTTTLDFTALASGTPVGLAKSDATLSIAAPTVQLQGTLETPPPSAPGTYHWFNIGSPVAVNGYLQFTGALSAIQAVRDSSGAPVTAILRRGMLDGSN